MKCRTSGGSTSITLAADAAAMPPKRIDALYESLTEEGEWMASPSILDLEEWRERQQFLLDKAELSAIRKDAIRQRLNQTKGEPTPDGAEFYAWQHIESRARQERALNSVEGVVDLHAPREHEHKYQLGEDGRPAYVWYASYGSNLNESRLMNYIEGGRPNGSTRHYSGCTDKTPPLADIPIRVHGFRPHFALKSGIWGGGIAFIDEASDESAFLGRAYLISINQYDEIVAQENGLSAKTATPVDLTTTLNTGRETQGAGAYETNLHIGDYRGAPVLSFTAPFGVQDALGSSGVVERRGTGVATATTNKPSAAYCRMIGSGLNETFGMSSVAQADYIRGCPGGDQWERRDLVRALRAPEPAATPTTRSWTNTRAKGDLFPPVKTYESREEQRSGIARWTASVTKARNLVTTLEANLAEKGHTLTKKELKEKQKVVADALKAAKEVETKRDKAKTQQPKEWFKGRHSRSRSDWKKFSEDLHKDITKTQERFRNTTPGTKESGRLAVKIEDMKSQHREASAKAQPADYSRNVYTESSTPSRTTPSSSGWVDGRRPNPDYKVGLKPVFPSGTSTDDDEDTLPGLDNTQIDTRFFSTETP